MPEQTPAVVEQDDIITIEAPPETIGGILRRLGPGLIVAGSIVGSGELIATTATGAQAGYWLLWLILIGCVIKVFVQVELGRYAIASGETTMRAMNQVPGPLIELATSSRAAAVSLRSNWLVWYWLAMFLASLGQLGGIVGGVGQALAISVPLTERGRSYNAQLEAETKYTVALAELRQSQLAGENEDSSDRIAELQSRLDNLGPLIVSGRREYAVLQLERVRQNYAARRAAGSDEPTRVVLLQEVLDVVDARIEAFGQRPDQVFDSADPEISGRPADFQAAFAGFGRRTAYDHQIWAAMITVATAIVLVLGRYGLIQTLSTVLVASFTFITVVNLAALQLTGDWAISWNDIVHGMSFQLPPKSETVGSSPLSTALMTFGIIGVGASELVTYPYWCLEKGYGRFTGPRDESPAWAERARGWMRVMKWDAWCSMVVYTFATIAFYLLGAAVLHRIRIFPSGTEMIRTLAVMYEPVFGRSTQILFLFGAFAVLYSTFFVANASHARVFPDALRVFGPGAGDERSYRRHVKFFSGLFPFICLTVYILFPQPTKLVLASGAMQAMMLPMLSLAALYFRYRRCDSRIRPGRLWDLCLWLSSFGMLLAGGWLFLTIVFPQLK